LPYHAPDRFGKTHQAKFLDASVLHTAGEDLFLEGLLEPYRSEALDLIRANIKHVDAFISVSDYYAEFYAWLSGDTSRKIQVVPLG